MCIPIQIFSIAYQNEKLENVGSETEGEAYAIADMMAYVKADVYSVNCGMAYGQEAMLVTCSKGLSSCTAKFIHKIISPPKSTDQAVLS
ncbi:ATP-dependent Clp protease proteolytic subunit [Quillaja saponaria]|uniref:ATP-dependent Clp protease proteolytic subunit n=1 Tax=Quillaja saponaria TaxID=32244 RepID=A0AAD7P8N3_QUISA|nr:ATP-dependent Clp protease proteolytic subunit [Quillaja saponaria]